LNQRYLEQLKIGKQLTRRTNGLRNVGTFCAKSAQKSPTLLRSCAGRYIYISYYMELNNERRIRKKDKKII
jgi:hypothetical protein